MPLSESDHEEDEDTSAETYLRRSNLGEFCTPLQMITSLRAMAFIIPEVERTSTPIVLLPEKIILEA